MSERFRDWSGEVGGFARWCGGRRRTLVFELASGDSVAACPPCVGDVDELCAERSAPTGTNPLAWLGFERPRNIRNLLKRMEAAGETGDWAVLKERPALDTDARLSR